MTSSDHERLVVTLTIAELTAILREVVVSQPPYYYSQRDSPLGKRRHLDAVKGGRLEGYIHGRLVLVRSADVHQFIESERAPGPRIVSRPPRKKPAESGAQLPPAALRRLAELTADTGKPEKSAPEAQSSI